MMGVASSDGNEPETTTTPMPFDDFFRREYPQLVPMLHALLGDRAQAEDVAQEAIAAAQEQWTRIERYDQPGAWVRRVALNRASNARRRRGREAIALRRVGVTAADDGCGADGEGGPDLPDADLWRLVRALPDQQRFAVALHYVEDLSIAEVAAVLECAEGTVKTHLSRARATLTRQLPRPSAETTP